MIKDNELIGLEIKNEEIMKINDDEINDFIKEDRKGFHDFQKKLFL